MIKRLLIYLLVAVLTAALAVHVRVDEMPDQAMVLGTLEGDTYTNEYLGFGCKLEGWSSPDGVIIDIFNMMISQTLKASLGDADALKQIGDPKVILLEQSRNKLQLVIILMMDVYQELNLSFDAAMTDHIKNYFADQDGIKAVSAEKTQIQMGSEKWNGVRISFNQDGTNCYEQWFVVYKADKIFLITITSYVTDATDRVLGKFFPLE